MADAMTRFPWTPNLIGYIAAPAIFALVYLMQRKRARSRSDATPVMRPPLLMN